MLNTININLKTDIKTDRPITLPIKLMSQDKNNNQFILRFTNGGESVTLDDSYTVEILTKFTKSGTSRLTTAKVRQDYATWEFDTAYITQDETVYNYVYVRKAGNLVVSADANCFVFSVGLSEIDKGAGKVAEAYDENYQNYLDEFKDNVDFEEIAQAEQARKDAELLREENYEQKVDTAIVEADVVSKVDNKVTELTPQINNLTAQLAQKANEDEVFLKQYGININDMDEPTRQAFLEAQGIDVNYVLGAENVKPVNTTFFKRGVNLFNKDTVFSGYYLNGATGAEIIYEGFFTSDFIPVDANKTYSRTNVFPHYVWYDSNMNRIGGGESATKQIVSPPNAKYLRISCSASQLPKMMVNEGDTLLPYEDFEEYFEDKYIKKIPSSKIEGIIKKEQLEPLGVDQFSIVATGKNLFNKLAITAGFYVNQVNGIIEPKASHNASEYIKVEPNGKYTFPALLALRVAFYDKDKKYISGANPPTLPLTVPANAVFIRFSTSSPLNSIQFEKGEISTSYEEFGYKFTQTVNSSSENGLEIALPQKLYALVGQEFNIYFDNIVNGRDTIYDFDVTCAIGSHFENYYRVTPLTAGTYPITIKAYQENKERASVTASLIVSAVSAGTGSTKNVLVIGDSTTDNGIAITKLNENFGNDAMNVSTIGTRGSGANKHEGRSGWTAKMYLTVAGFGAITNAFWNPTTSKFDFSYYMTNNSLATPDYVIINLGINDMFSFATDEAAQTGATVILAEYQTMIDNIKTFNANIKIGIALTIPPAYSQDAFARSYDSGQTRWRYKRNNFIWVKALLERFQGKEASGIYLIPSNVNLDTRHNFPYDVGNPTVPVNARNTLTTVKNFAQNAGVHPDTSGYWQVADVYWYWLKSFES